MRHACVPKPCRTIENSDSEDKHATEPSDRAPKPDRFDEPSRERVPWAHQRLRIAVDPASEVKSSPDASKKQRRAATNQQRA